MVHLVLDDLGRKACELQSLLLEIHVLAERCVRYCRYRRHPNSLRSQAQRRTERQIPPALRQNRLYLLREPGDQFVLYGKGRDYPGDYDLYHRLKAQGWSDIILPIPLKF